MDPVDFKEMDTHQGWVRRLLRGYVAPARGAGKANPMSAWTRMAQFHLWHVLDFLRFAQQVHHDQVEELSPRGALRTEKGGA
jgi:hypothetical protein